LINPPHGSIRSTRAEKAPRSPIPAGPPASRRPKKTRSARAAAAAYPDYDTSWRPEDAIVAEAPGVLQPSHLAYRDDVRGLYLYHGDCLEVMDRLIARHPEGLFDLIFADPPYFLSNGGIT
jgi:hypothetical protein